VRRGASQTFKGAMKQRFCAVSLPLLLLVAASGFTMAEIRRQGGDWR